MADTIERALDARSRGRMTRIGKDFAFHVLENSPAVRERLDRHPSWWPNLNSLLQTLRINAARALGELVTEPYSQFPNSPRTEGNVLHQR